MSSASSSGSYPRVKGVLVRGPYRRQYEQILTADALSFVAELHRKFEQTRRALLSARETRQARFNAGEFPTFLTETASIRRSAWTAAKVVSDLEDRRVEITGPVERKMIINALNSGARVFMADFEDSSAPTWDVLLSGQVNLRDAIEGTISLEQGGKKYRLRDDIRLATLMVRPRGWHLPEAHIVVDGDVMSASLLDFGLYFFHNAKKLTSKGSGPYFYLPKMESHKEARLWNDVFVFAQQKLGIPNGTVRATVLIETLPAAFEMDEIIYELRDHSAGLNCGRWDYIFSYIKKFRNHADLVLPDRAQVTMTVPFMASYVKLLIATCHKRGVSAMGGMAAFIPVNNDEKANNAAIEKVRADKLREVKAGCDGTWVAHPGLIKVALDVFNEHMTTPNQIHKAGEITPVDAKDLITAGFKGTITRAGVLNNLDVGLGYLEAWLRGNGCVPLHNMMEDAATAEIARCQIWQWIHHGSVTAEGDKITKDFVKKLFDEHLNTLKKSLGDETFNKKRKFVLAVQLYEKMLLSDQLDDFLTLIAYPHIISVDDAKNPKSKL